MRELIDAQLTEWTWQYRRAASWLHQIGQSLYANRLEDILEEAERGENLQTVAFCGLFSAGKSSLINTLTNGQTLATGAIPTTADIASVLLPNTNGRVVLLDTPGVDSTDESHREATMNALHRADGVVLVADYQHVEAEENLELLRAFSDEGKRLVLVVNQIDKHLDFELPFKTFQMHVEEALEDYGIDVDHIFYTSTSASVHNQANVLRAWLEGLGNADDGQPERLRKRLDEVLKDAVEEIYRARREAARWSIEDAMGKAPLHVEEATTWLAGQLQEQARQREESERAYQEHEEALAALREAWVRSVELAQIAPYETTEKGRSYVESLRPEFKVGFLSSAKKTQAERQARLEAFVQDLQDRLGNYLLVPLRNQLSHDIRQTPWADKTWSAEIPQIDVRLDTQTAQGLVKSGALVSSQYPYQYVKDVVSHVKREVLAKLTTLTDRWFASAKETFYVSHEAQRHELKGTQVRIEVLEAYLKLEKELDDTLKRVIAGEVPTV